MSIASSRQRSTVTRGSSSATTMSVANRITKCLASGVSSIYCDDWRSLSSNNIFIITMNGVNSRRRSTVNEMNSNNIFVITMNGVNSRRRSTVNEMNSSVATVTRGSSSFNYSLRSSQ